MVNTKWCNINLRGVSTKLNMYNGNDLHFCESKPSRPPKSMLYGMTTQIFDSFTSTLIWGGGGGGGERGLGSEML